MPTRMMVVAVRDDTDRKRIADKFSVFPTECKKVRLIGPRTDSKPMSRRDCLRMTTGWQALHYQCPDWLMYRGESSRTCFQPSNNRGLQK
jgi:hypothetical protein